MTMNPSRTMNSLRNSTVEVICQMLVAIMTFICRTVFIKTMSIEYLGINSLFVNILSVLSLADFGVEIAVTYRLYQSIAENNEKLTRALMRFLRNAFRVTAAVVIALGLLCLPFLEAFIKHDPNISNLSLIFLLYLFSYAEKYLISYRRPLVIADQKKYIDTLYSTFFLLIQNMIQIMILIFTHNFILYLIASVLCTLLNNIALSIKAKKMYPYLKDQEAAQLDPQEKKALFKMLPPLIYRSASVAVISNTTNILISAFLGLASVALYSNYYTLTSIVNQFVYLILKGPVASFGNLNVSQDKNKLRSIFEQYQLITFWLYGFSVVCFWTLIDPFVVLWIGKPYLIGRTITAVMLLNFYLLGFRHVINAIKDSMGLFIYFKYKPIWEGAISIAVALVLVKPMGIVGILLGTTAGQFATLVVDPYILYKYSLKAKVASYYKKFIFYIATVAFSCVVCEYLCFLVDFANPIFDFAIVFMITMIIPNVIFAVFYYKTNEFKSLEKKMFNILWRIKTKIKSNKK